VRFFIGIQRSRSEYKGTDIMLRALERVAHELPERCEIVKVESVPFEQYVKLMNNSDVILDQLYSYTPAMNALEAMARGLIVVGGGEPENYEILGETELRPIVNVQPNEESVYQAVRQLALHPEQIPLLKQQGIDYIARHHDYLKVAKQYVDWWQHTP
jgi:glycosyltransferase involved in cell wall biosynthesis